MSESIHAKRRRDAMADLAAAAIAGALIALAAALLIEALALGIGAAIGQPAWHRAWVEARYTQFIAALQGLPPLGALAAIINTLQGLLPPSGTLRDVCTLLATLYAFCLVPGRWLARAFMARYDDEALRVAPVADFGMRWAGPLGEHQAAAWAWLQSWCVDGAGTGRSPPLRPWVMPQVETRFAVAVLAGVNGVGKSHLAESFSRHLDGSDRLAALPGRGARWRLRLHVKLQNCLWWRARRPEDLWDCGYLVEDPAARQRLGQFRPRRATLLIADELQPVSLLQCIELLNTQRVEFRHPVRLLVIDTALPAALGLVWRAETRQWHSDAQELGVVPVHDLSAVRLGVPQFRTLVGAQQAPAGSERLRLMGPDSDWAPLVDALDGLPILLAEAYRLVRDDGDAFGQLLRDDDPQARLVQRQSARATPRLPADPLGQRRELLRERVLPERARRRAAALRAALSVVKGGEDESYHGLMVASIANGSSASQLGKRLGWRSPQLMPERLSLVYAGPPAAGWVPALKPAVIADEMLRLHFDAARGAELPDDTRERIAATVRSAWQLNPAGTLRTTARWQRLGPDDAFAQAVLRLPTLAELESTAATDADTRATIVHAFCELAVLHGGDLAHAGRALAALNAAELAAAESALLALLLRPDAQGLPAMVLWLQLRRLCWPELQRMGRDAARDFGLRLVQQAQKLVRQSAVNWVQATPSRLQALEAAYRAAMPLMASLTSACSADPDFQAAAVALMRQCDGIESDGQLRPAARLLNRTLMRVSAMLNASPRRTLGSPAEWTDAVMHAMAAADQPEVLATAETRWTFAGDLEPCAADEPADTAWGRARCLALAAGANLLDAPDVTENAVKKLLAVAGAWPEHEGIQLLCARAWRFLGRVQAGRDATTAARVAALVAPFPGNRSMQLESAGAWADLASTHWNTDVAVSLAAAQAVDLIASRYPTDAEFQTEAARTCQGLAAVRDGKTAQTGPAAATRAAALALAFPANEIIQHIVANAWWGVASASADHDVPTREAAARAVALIAAAWPGHEGIQCCAAKIWLSLAEAHSGVDVAATLAAAERVDLLARHYPLHQPIQRERVAAWVTVVRTYGAMARLQRGGLATLVWAAAERGATVAAAFPDHEGMQQICADGWRDVVEACLNSDPARTEAAAERVESLALRFPANEQMQFERAVAWSQVAWSWSDSDVEATAAAVERVAAVAAEFATSKTFQQVHVYALRLLAQAQAHRSIAATAAAARRAEEIAAGFAQHEDIQFESARACRNLAFACCDHDPAATEEAAARTARYASAWPAHELMQVESALAWRFLAESAVKFDDRSRVTIAMARLDAMCHEQRLGTQLTWQIGRKVPAHVLAERELARATVDRWRRSGGTDSSP